MTEIAQELLEGVKKGDYVQIRYGTDKDQITVEGSVEKWTVNFLYLQKRDGEVTKIRLDDNLRALDPKKKPDPKENTIDDDEKTFTASDNNTEAQIAKEQRPVAVEYRVLRQMAALLPGSPFEFVEMDEIAEIKQMVKESDNRELKKVAGGVLDSLCVAIKNKEFKSKYHNLRAKVMKLWEVCAAEVDYSVFYYLLGVISISAGDYEYALEPLVRARKYALAAYSAASGELKDAAYMLSLCAHLNGEYVGIDQYISESCVATKDVEFLKVLLDTHKNDSDICEKIAACAYFLFSASNGRLSRDITPYNSAYEAASSLLEAIPNGWKCSKSAVSYWKEYQQYAYPVTSSSADLDGDRVYTGHICKYNADNKWGFISPNHFFYIAQVYDDSEKGILLRRMLSAGLWKQLEVSYMLGESKYRANESAATAIELTEAGYAAALKCIESESQPDKRRKGFVDSFNAFYQNGCIISEGKKYRFKLDAIADPWLKAYYTESYSPREQDVTFEAVGRNAGNICWEKPSAEDRDMYAFSVTKDDLRAWEEYLSGQNQPVRQVVVPNEDPYRMYPYSDLKEWNPVPLKAKTVPLTWGGKCPVQNVRQENGKEAAAQKETSKSASAQVKNGVAASEWKLLAEQASKERVSGRLNQAAESFKVALGTGAFEEKVLSEYLTVLQQLGRIDEALETLNMYEHKVSEAKLLNLKIGLYDKKRDYMSLIPLYERAFLLASTVSTKSHNLGRLIVCYAKVGDYENALKTCKRWEIFYNQNRHSPDAEKLKKAISFISRQKAYCLYFSGQTEEAREIAISLIRTNPTDAIANSILDGTLVTSKNLSGSDTVPDSQTMTDSDDYSKVSDLDNWWDDELEDEAEEAHSQFPRFVRFKVQQSDISASLKSQNIRDGRYIGTAEEGLRDIKSLVSRQKVSTKTRCDILFSACKLLEQIEEGKNSSTYRKYRFAGRAMTAWGDIMVAQASQLDTTRMAYLYALRVLIPGKRGPERAWDDAYNRYIKSYFLAQNGRNSLEEYINNQTIRNDRDNANTDIFVVGRIPEVLLPEFMVGMLIFADAIGNQPDKQEIFINELYDRNPDLRKLACRQLGCLTEIEVQSEIGREEFCEAVRSAVEKLKEKTSALNQLLVEVSNVLMRVRIPVEEMDRLSPGQWRNYLTNTDYGRLSQIYRIVKRSQDYYDSNDFENRADCLRAALLEINELLQVIQKEPTDVSYDIFLPVLNQMSLKMADKQAELYQMFLPKITVEETIPPFWAPDGFVQIQLAVRNGRNYQTADSFQITSVAGAEILRCELPPAVPSLRGGEESERIIRVLVDPSAQASGSFSATISYSYKCSDTPQNIITKSQDIECTFVIRNENFVALVNPFAAYEEKVMESEDMFLGRTTQINQILNMIHTPEGEMNYGRAIVMFGQTRSGKSSLLYHLTNKLEQKYGDELLIWDIGNLGEMDMEKPSAFMANFVYMLLNTGLESVYRNETVMQYVDPLEIEAVLSQMIEKPDFAVSFFKTYMKKLNEILRREKKLIVLIADEFTYLHGYIKSGKLPDEFMRFWKALMQKYCIFAIIAGQDDMPEFVREYPNDFGSMELMKLNYLAEEDAKKLIRMPLERHNDRTGLFRQDGCIDELYKLTAGSAYLTIILCSKLVDYLNEKGAYMITKGIVQDFLRTRAFGPKGFLLDKHFEPQIDERGKVEELHHINLELLLCVARLTQTDGYATLDNISCMGLSLDQIQKHLDRLVDRNVLVREGRDGYWIQVKLLREWLIKTMGA